MCVPKTFVEIWQADTYQHFIVDDWQTRCFWVVKTLQSIPDLTSTRWHCSPWIHHLMFSEREECSWGLTFEMLSVCLFFVMVYLCCPWLRVCHHHLQKSEAYLRDAKLIISFELLFFVCLIVCLFVCFLISTRDNFVLDRMNAVSENCIRFDATKWWNGVCSLTDALKGHWRSHHGGTGCKRW